MIQGLIRNDFYHYSQIFATAFSLDSLKPSQPIFKTSYICNLGSCAQGFLSLFATIRNYFSYQIPWNIHNQSSSALHLWFRVLFAMISSIIHKYSLLRFSQDSLKHAQQIFKTGYICNLGSCSQGFLSLFANIRNYFSYQIRWIIRNYINLYSQGYQP